MTINKKDDETNGYKKKAGKPLPTGGKRVNTSKAKADAKKIGKSTVAKIENTK